MKKYNLFKVLGITFLIAVILTWILPTASYSSGFILGDRNPLGLFEIIEYPFYSFGFFSNIILFLLSVGGLYGLLNNIDIYKTFTDNIIKKFYKKEKWFLIIVILLITISTSFCNFGLGIFVVFPFLFTIILGLGYNKYTALLTTFGANIIGIYGSTHSGIYISVNDFLGVAIDNHMLGKIGLLVIGIGLLLLFALIYSNKKLERKELVIKNDKVKSIHSWPLVLIGIILILLFIMGTFNWNGIVDTNVFIKLHDSIMNVPIFYKIFGNIQAIGYWGYDTYLFFVIVAILLITLFYRIKFNDMISYIGKGISKMLIPTALVTMTYSILFITIYKPVFLNITNFLMLMTNRYNIATSGISIMINSIFNMDISFFARNQLPYVMGIVNESVFYPLISIMYVSLFGAMSLIMPTSVVLVVTLAYLDISWIKWVKFIWKLFLALLIVAFIVFAIIY